MTKKEAKQKYEAGEIRICYDTNNEKLLREIIGDVKGIFAGAHYYIPKVSNKTINIVKLSEIEEEVVWLGSDMQYKSKADGKWYDCNHTELEYRLKPKPEYRDEIEALQSKAKENGMKAVITFEKL